jgi:hypothetical protein
MEKRGRMEIYVPYSLRDRLQARAAEMCVKPSQYCARVLAEHDRMLAQSEGGEQHKPTPLYAPQKLHRDN